MTKIIRKIQKVLFFPGIRMLGSFKPRLATNLSIYVYRKWGMKFTGKPNYLSSTSWFDGTDYSRITIGEGVTISSNVSILTHDWALHTIGKSIGEQTSEPVGRHGTVVIEDYAFIGRGALLLPDSHIGRGSLVGAGSVVRGKIPPMSIYIGNPGKVVGNTEEYYNKNT